MSLKRLINELNEIENNIKDLEKLLKTQKSIKQKLWTQIMRDPQIKDIYWEYGLRLKKELKEILEDNGYKRG